MYTLKGRFFVNSNSKRLHASAPSSWHIHSLHGTHPKSLGCLGHTAGPWYGKRPPQALHGPHSQALTRPTHKTWISTRQQQEPGSGPPQVRNAPPAEAFSGVWLLQSMHTPQHNDSTNNQALTCPRCAMCRRLRRCAAQRQQQKPCSGLHGVRNTPTAEAVAGVWAW